MDSTNPTNREEIAEYAKFLGAIRLPSNAFAQNALTNVTTDIVFFQKNTSLENTKTWTQTSESMFYDKTTEGQTSGVINTYFKEKPEQILGQMVFQNSQFGSELSCIASPDLVLSDALSNCVQKLPRNIFKTKAPEIINKPTFSDKEISFIESEYFTNLKLNSFAIIPGQGKLLIKEIDAFGTAIGTPKTLKNNGSRNRISGMIQIRDTVRSLLNLEKSDGDENLMESKRRLLNIQYDAFKRKFGFLNSQINRSLFRNDPESSLIQSLELNYDKGLTEVSAIKLGKDFRPASADKATIFSKRVLQHAQIASSAKSIHDALSISLRETGKINFVRMSELLRNADSSFIGNSPSDIQLQLQKEQLIFKNPASDIWEIRDKYLTGNVRKKLAIAKTAAKQSPNDYQINVDALTEVIPKDIEPVDIGVKFGTTWIPSEDFVTFIEEKIGDLGFNHQLDYIPVLGRWEVKLSLIDPAVNNELWGIPEYPADKLITSLLTNRSIKVEKPSGRYDDNDKPIMVIDQELTAVAMQKANEIQQSFLDWVWTDDERRTRLSTLYNERFNTHVVPNYDGSHLTLSEASPNVTLRQHQKDAVWRAIQEGTTLLDHVVGAGKTLVAVAAIKESKRMGFLNKPMVVVPNSLTYQWRDEFYKMYPDANILVAEKSDFAKENRERFFSRIATGDWDAVVVAHSSFKLIDMPKKLQQEILKEQIDAVIEALSVGAKNQGSRATIKQLEKQKERMQTKYDKMLAQKGSTSVDFSDLGVDALFVDESHEYKNLSFTTSMNVSGLGNIAGSAKALDLFVKCRYLQKQNDGKGVYFLTGTPISNTIAEVFTLQRYMQFDELKAKEIDYFDAWASNFGKVTNSWELDATGVNYKLKSRFAQFDNVPELLSMYRTFADVVTKDDLDEQSRALGQRSMTPPIMGGKPFNHVVERSPDQAEYMDKIIYRMENLPKDPTIDNPLKITNDARKAGLDYRLINPMRDDFEGSKTRIYF